MRTQTYGRLDGRMVVVVWTDRGDDRRIISMRKANDREQARYAHLLDEVWHDPDDAPELTDEFFERAFHYEGGKLIRRGREPARAAGSNRSSFRSNCSTVSALSGTAGR